MLTDCPMNPTSGERDEAFCSIKLSILGVIYCELATLAAESFLVSEKQPTRVFTPHDHKRLTCRDPIPLNY